MDIVTAFRKLQQTTERLKIMAEQAEEGILLVDSDGIARFANTAMAQMHGYPSSKDLIGKKISMFHTDEQVKTDLSPMIEETKRIGKFSDSIGHLRNDGTVFTAHTKMVLLKDRRKRAVGLVEFVTGITEHQPAEPSLIRRISELTATNANLQQQVSGHQQAIDQLQQKLDDKEAELSRANDRLEQQIIERERSEENLNTELDTSEEQSTQQVSELRDLEGMVSEGTENKDELSIPRLLTGRVLDENKLRSLAEMAKRLSR